MKRLIYKSHITVVGIGLLAMTATSCSDSFLDEEMVSTITQDYFETEQGLDQLIVSTYNAERLRHPYTEGGFMFEIGHDCGLVNGNNTINQFSSAAWNTSGAWNTIPGYGNSFMGTQSKQQSRLHYQLLPGDFVLHKGHHVHTFGQSCGQIQQRPLLCSQAFVGSTLQPRLSALYT